MSTENMIATEEALVAKQQAALATQTDIPMGFEDEEAGDMIIPRVKVIQTLSPERKDKVANEGDIINLSVRTRLPTKATSSIP